MATLRSLSFHMRLSCLWSSSMEITFFSPASLPICNRRNPCQIMEFGWITELKMVRVQYGDSNYSTMMQSQISNQHITGAEPTSKVQYNNQATNQHSGSNSRGLLKYQIGENVPRKDKAKFLVNMLLDLEDSKEAVYGMLDAWVAWEKNFPLVSLRRALVTLEKEQQWHRIIQVIKWMLSKGQGTTMGTYGQLIRALDMDHRAKEAHEFWVKKFSNDLHSVPWQLCKIMISIYYRDNMLESLVKLFKGLEAFDRKPPDKSVVQKFADACEMLGLLDEKKRVLEKYVNLFSRRTESSRKTRKALQKK